MTESIAEICERWEKRYRYGSVEDRKDRMRLWQPYYSMIYAAGEAAASQPVREDELIRQLADEHVLSADAAVLDIGCGTGTYALQMVPHVKKVTAMDMNETALRILKKRAAEAAIENISVKNCAWEDYRGRRRFDIVFSSMCPAVCNPEELRRMESLSSGYCVLITVMTGSYDKHRKAMMAELGIRPEGMITDFDTYVSVLTALGREFRTGEKTVRRRFRTSLEELLAKMPVYLKIFGIPEAESEAFVRGYFARNQEDGFLQDESFIKTGMIYWQPE